MDRMIYSIFIGALSSLLISNIASGQIQDIDEIESINQYLQKDTLVLMNVGNTLFSPSSNLANNLWREYFVCRVKAVEQDEVKAQSIIDLVKGWIVEKIPKIPTENITPHIIAQWQQDKVPVFGYTQRLISTTYAADNGSIIHNHLSGMGIHLDKTLSYFLSKEFRHHDYAFERGIIFTNKNPIGPAFLHFLAETKACPDLVIVIDDSLESLKNAEAAFKSTSCIFQGLRYQKSKAYNSTFNADIGTIEFFAYIDDNRLMSDVEALQIKNEHPEIIYEVLLDNWIHAQSGLTL